MRRLVVLLALLLVSCDPLARTEVKLTFDETGEKVAVEILSDTSRVKDLRSESGEGFAEDILRARDEWSARLANANAKNERIIFDRDGRELTRVEQRANVEARDLQRLFYDVGVSAQMTRGESWSELTLYPGSSSRASRQQRAEVSRQLDAFAARAAAYYQAIGAMYAYLDANAHRAEPLFVAVFEESGESPESLSNEEREIVRRVRAAGDALFSFGEGQDGNAFAKAADLVFNPFPGRVDIVVPGEPLVVEGFLKSGDGKALVATTATPLEALSKLAGKWVAPDPLAAALDGEKISGAEMAKRLAGEPRKASPVVDAADVRRALEQALQPAPRYRVRFVTKPAAPSS